MDSNNPTRPGHPPTPPVARRVESRRECHGDVVVDEYAWLRTQGKDDPEVRSYLEAENAWTEASLAHVADLRERLFGEIKGRIKETDLSVPVRKGGWWYYSRTEEGAQYPIHCRKAARSHDGHAPAEEEVEQVMLDQNVEAGDAEFFAVGAFDTTPDAGVLAWSSDLEGDEVYTMRFRDLATGDDLDDVIEGTYYGTAWGADGATFFYVRPDEAMRPYQLWRHQLGTSTDDDVLVHTEDDERFFLGVGTTKDERFLLLGLESKVTSEVRVLEADDPMGEFRVVEPRRQDVEYGLEHHNGRFLIVTNADGAENFKLVSTPVATPGADHWSEVIGARDDVKLSGVDVFARHLVVFERAEGLRRIRVRALSGDGLEGDDHLIDQPEAVSTASGGANPEFDSRVLRYGYTSMVTPSSVFAYDMDTRQRTLLKQQPVLGGYDPGRYVTERLWATADDGTAVPISVVRRADRMREVNGPALLYGYGSYETSIDPGFSSARLSLLDRGFLFAIAHVRGGGEMGRRWYNEGKLLAKRNTFSDFIACARYLVEQGWTSPSRLAIRGGSAGGLLVGAVLNMAPEAFGAAVAEVPFVDVVEAILDASLPLTVLEWEEWGNPAPSAEVYAYMKGYDPYLNVSAKAYPPILVTAGINDPRVPYWQPAKWVARLRATSPGTGVLLKTEMGAGHMGPSGRYDAWRDEALVYAFLLDALGVAAAEPGPFASDPPGPFASDPPGPFASDPPGPFAS
ncbi:MAG: S9 family peptidase [Actinobacteria bacterium]|nr:S9 family peptidase [Actinomycetota bacterium]